jgi:hypothetical protein
MVMGLRRGSCNLSVQVLIDMIVEFILVENGYQQAITSLESLNEE